MRYSEMEDKDLSALIENRWSSSNTLWEEIKKITKKNTDTYEGKSEWFKRMRIPPTRPKVNSNRIFTNTEAVINSLIANPPKPNAIPSRKGDEAKKVASAIEKTLKNRYDVLNTKEILRMALRDLYFSRLLVIKPFWDNKINNFNVRRVDPTKVRFSSMAKNELESEFAIEEIDTTLTKLIEMFPTMEEKIIKESGIPKDRVLIENPTCSYKEAWIGQDLCIKYKNLVIYKGKNPYWDWDGLITTKEELLTMEESDEPKRMMLKRMREAMIEVPDDEGTSERPVQEVRKEEKKSGVEYESYLSNYFDVPRKPYIFATVLNNEDKPIGRTSFIEQAQSLQELVDRAKYQIYLNMEMVNGITKVDSETGITKADAQTLRYDAGGVLWGKGVNNGVTREFGSGLPAFVFQDMQDSRDEIDNIMAATSAFRGEREGQETKAGRLALIEQSFLRLNEMVQVVDYVMQELFGWWTQLIKVNYTEKHEIKEFGPDESLEIIELMQDDIEQGIEIRVIPGKTLPEDRRFIFERAQADVGNGLISPLTYLEDAGYQNPKEVAKSAFEWSQNPAAVLGIEQQTPPGMPGMPQQIQPPQAQPMPQVGGVPPMLS